MNITHGAFLKLRIPQPHISQLLDANPQPSVIARTNFGSEMQPKTFGYLKTDPVKPFGNIKHCHKAVIRNM